MASLSGLKTYGGVDLGDVTDAELSMCLEAAIAYCANSGVAEMDDDALYDLLVYRLATFYQIHKGFPDNGRDADMVGITGMILQLRTP